MQSLAYFITNKNKILYYILFLKNNIAT